MSFILRRPQTEDEAASLLTAAGAVPMGGGTDLLVAIDESLMRPELLVDLRGVAALRHIEVRSDGSVWIGAAVSISEIAAHATIASGLVALAQACEAVASPALRNMGTLGGNLCQRPRCWYFRRGIPCHKNGGDNCPAVEGENQYLAVLDAGPCFAVHPSDPAVALAALDATIEIASARGRRAVPAVEFFTPPGADPRRENVLAGDEFVRAAIIPAASRGGVQMYRKSMQRAAWDFALASIAAVRRPDGAVRMVLGGVAPGPWRVPHSVEEDVASGGLDEESAAALADRALYDARPLSGNGYKVALAGSLLRDGIGFLGA